MKFIQRAVSAHTAQFVSFVPTSPSCTNAQSQNANQILHAETIVLGQQVESLQVDRSILLEETTALRQRNESLLSDIVESNGLLIMADARLAEVEGSLALPYAQTANWITQNEDTTARYHALQALHDIKEAELYAAETSLISAETRIASLESQLAEVQDEAKKVEGERDDLTVEGCFNFDKILTLESDLASAKGEKDALVRQLEKAVEALTQLEQQAQASQAAWEITRMELEANQHALTVAQEQADSYEVDKIILEARVDGLSAQVDALQQESSDLKDALHAAEEQAKTEVGESMASLHLEQEKTKSLESRLVHSDELLASATHRADTCQQEVSALRAEVESVRGDLFEKQLEVELITQQEQKAMDALEVEERARMAAEKERDDMAARIAGLLAEMETMKAQQLALQERNEQLEDRNQVFEMQLARECDAHASTRDDMDRMQARLATVISEKENQSAVNKPSTPRRSSTFLRRQKTPLQSRNADSDAHLPTLGQIDDDRCYTRENSPISRSPTVPLTSTSTGFSLHRRASSSASPYRSFSDRLVSPTAFAMPRMALTCRFIQFRRGSPDSSTASPRTDSEFFISPALS